MAALPFQAHTNYGIWSIDFDCIPVFSGVNKGLCKDAGDKIDVKFTTCTSEEYTCNDGQCISMQNRLYII